MKTETYFGAKFESSVCSELLRMVLFVLDEGVAHLETYVDFPGKEALQRSCLSALQARDSNMTAALLSEFCHLQPVAKEPSARVVGVWVDFQYHNHRS